jgi:hypothetical protein
MTACLLRADDAAFVAHCRRRAPLRRAFHAPPKKPVSASESTRASPLRATRPFGPATCEGDALDASAGRAAHKPARTSRVISRAALHLRVDDAAPDCVAHSTLHRKSRSPRQRARGLRPCVPPGPSVRRLARATRWTRRPGAQHTSPRGRHASAARTAHKPARPPCLSRAQAVREKYLGRAFVCSIRTALCG